MKFTPVHLLLAILSFLIRVAIDLLNFIRDIFLPLHAKAVDFLARSADRLDEDEMIPSLRYLFFNIDSANDFTPPSKELMESFVAPYTDIINPMFLGLDNIPNDRPVMLIGNHALYAIEYPLLLNKVYQEKGFFIRAAGDYLHKYLPHWPIFKYFGAFDGSKESCIELMKAKKNILIFPGGGREVLKRKTDKKYELMWKDRRGFAKLAIEYGYTIVPFASYGSEDMIEVLFDVPLTRLLGREMYLPIPKPPNPNNLQRIYFSFGTPIPTSQYQGHSEIEKDVKEVRDKAREAVEDQLALLKGVQQSDPESKRLPHILKKSGLSKKSGS